MNGVWFYLIAQPAATAVDCLATVNRPPKGKDTHTMSNDKVVAINKSESFIDDPISEILRQGERNLLAQSLEAEIEIFLNPLWMM